MSRSHFGKENEVKSGSFLFGSSIATALIILLVIGIVSVFSARMMKYLVFVPFLVIVNSYQHIWQ